MHTELVALVHVTVAQPLTAVHATHVLFNTYCPAVHTGVEQSAPVQPVEHALSLQAHSVSPCVAVTNTSTIRQTHHSVLSSSALYEHDP